MEKITGILERITYINDDTGYSVIKIKSKGYKELITIVGDMASVSVGTVFSY